MNILNKFCITLVSLLIILSCGSKPKVEIKEPVAPAPPPPPPAPIVETKNEINIETPAPTPPPPPEPEKPKEETPPPKQEEKSVWSYEGLTGPSMWGDLKEEYALCKNGKSQSPVDLKWHHPKKNNSLKINFKEGNYKVIDSGHTVQFNFEPGNLMSIKGEKYSLIQMHFHMSSEHTFSGQQYPLEAHFVHKTDKGQLAVIAVLFKEGAANPVIDSLWKQIPHNKYKEVSASDNFNPESLLPSSHTFYTYQGSLTIPPCNEGVTWLVMNTPVEISKDQLNQFELLYPKNFRPVQELNGRKLENY